MTAWWLLHELSEILGASAHIWAYMTTLNNGLGSFFSIFPKTQQKLIEGYLGLFCPMKNFTKKSNHISVSLLSNLHSSKNQKKNNEPILRKRISNDVRTCWQPGPNIFLTWFSSIPNTLSEHDFYIMCYLKLIRK